jgi:hypothetical protein
MAVTVIRECHCNGWGRSRSAIVMAANVRQSAIQMAFQMVGSAIVMATRLAKLCRFDGRSRLNGHHPPCHMAR